MSDSSGHKPITNTLLSAATTSSFFEEAAMLVPVPIVEAQPQEPAIAEIDLNSDDSSSNRGSVEKEFPEQQLNFQQLADNLNDTVSEETAAPISLFSRAATGVDAFSRMLAGATTSKPPPPVQPQPPPSQISHDDLEVESKPSIVNLQAPPSRQESAESETEITSAVSLFAAGSSTQRSKTPDATWPPKVTSDVSTLFSSGKELSSSSSSINSNSTNSSVLPAFAPTTAVSRPFSAGVPTFPPPTTGGYNQSSFTTPNVQAPIPFGVNPNSEQPSYNNDPAFSNSVTSYTTPPPSQIGSTTGPRIPDASTSTPNYPNMANPIGPSTHPSTAKPTTPPTYSSIANPTSPPTYPSIANPISPPTYPSMANPTTTKTYPSMTNSTPNPLAPPSHPPASSVQSTPPPPSSNSNAFRLGSQRMKYVPCPEMQAAPSSVPPAVQPQVLPPTAIPSYGQNTLPDVMFKANSNISNLPPHPTVHSPPASLNMGVTSSSPLFSPVNSSGVMSPGSPGGHHMYSSPLSKPNMPPVVGTTYYPGSDVQHYGPKELPPLTYHWFYRKDVDGKVVWKPFSIIDSVALEDAYANDPEKLVPTDGGRYDVCVKKRLKMPVYWEELPVEVRRGSWFYKGPMDNRFIPYNEEFSVKLEKEYADCMRTGTWQKRLEFPGGESVILHNDSVVVHFCQAAAPDDWGNLPESQIRPRVVKRGCEEIEVEDGESTQIDHLVFVVHGIGPICDFKLRNIVEAVDDFRGLSIQLIHSHFRDAIEKNIVGRVEFLPVSWHKSLHGDKGIDEQLKRITLRSIPKFRDFTNDTLLDILFYTSPVYCQTIINSVGSELNRLYKLFLTRNPTFKGNVSLTGHSLGSLIVFDLLAHQPQVGSVNNEEKQVAEAGKEVELTSQQAPTAVESTTSSSSRVISYTVGNAGTGQPFISYPTLDFSPTSFYALGSPIAMFVTVRGIEKLGNDFRLPTCPAFFNIFHPYDPVAYRIETLIDPTFQSRPVLIPHHKGRKRIHLELKETMARVGADIKQRVMDAVKNTWNTVYQYTGMNKSQENLENEIQSAIAGEIEKKSEAEGVEDENANIMIGSLNGGRRIDHVLQEAPYETFNEYVFAMSTHVGYWESEDTMLLILTETYGAMGIQRDRQVSGPQGVVSPTHALPMSSATHNPIPYNQGSIANNYANSFSNPYQPSAPPYVDHQAAGQPAITSTQSMFASPTISTPSVQTPVPVVPMIPPANQVSGVLLPPNPVASANSAIGGSKMSVIGNRPVADPTYYPRGVDPTAPMVSMSQVGPPPKAGFVPKLN